MAFGSIRLLIGKCRFYSSILPVEVNEVLSRLSDVQLNSQNIELSQLQTLYNGLIATRKEATQIQQILADQVDPEMKVIFQQELQNYTIQIKNHEDKLVEYIKTKVIQDSAEDNELILEIRSGTGGTEASLFAHDMAELYKKYCALKGWKMQKIYANKDCSKSLREGIFLVEGKGCRKAFNHEAGVHRVQRIPASENCGRVHTSTVTVAVLPKMDSQFQLKASDIRTELYRASSGSGGQHLNTTASAVRITHIPTGIIYSSIRERCQHLNREHALKLLHIKLTKIFAEKQTEDLNSTRKEQVIFGFIYLFNLRLNGHIVAKRYELIISIRIE